MSEIVAFVGVMGSGKDYNSDLLRANGYARVDFKDPLLEMVSEMVGFSVRDEYDFFKVAIVGMRKPNTPIQVAMVMSEVKELQKKYPGIVTGRMLLQRVGTEVMRKRDPDYWVRQYVDTAFKHLRQGTSVVTADCRLQIPERG